MPRLLTKLRTLTTAWRLKRIVWGLERGSRYREAEERLLQLLSRVEERSGATHRRNTR